MARNKGSANLAASLEVLAGAPLDARLVVDNLTDLITASTFPYSYVGMPVAVKSEEAIYMLTATPTTTIDNWKKIGSDGGKQEIFWGYLYNNKFWEESTHTTEITAATDTLYITKDTDSFYKYTGTDYVKIGGGDAVVYQPGGSYLFANIPALSAATLGFVYDVQDAFTTTSDFLEGAGNKYPAGTDVSVVNVGTTANPVYKYNIFIGTLSGYQKKIQYNALPTANADELGNIYQYVGITTSSLTNGCWYKCVSDGESTPTYSWEMVATQEVDRVIAKADFDLLPAAQKNNGLTYYIPDASAVSNLTVMGNRFDKANIYTADERMVGSWMGKPLYQKTVSGTIPTGSNWIVLCSLGNTCELKTCNNGIIKYASYDMAFPSESRNIVLNSDISNRVTGTVSFFSNMQDDYGKPYEITLQYTKTTDGTISIGTENDYSTDEMIIGTWIDGSTLYQKSLYWHGATTANVLTTIASNFFDGDSIDQIVEVKGSLGNSAGTTMYAIPYVSENSATRVEVGKNGTVSVYTIGNDTFGDLKVNLTVQYTKTV